MTKLSWRKALKIGRSDRYGLNIAAWLGTDAIASFDVIAPSGSDLVLSDIVFANNSISAIISGATQAGEYDIVFTYSTAQRSDCAKVRLTVTPQC